MSVRSTVPFVVLAIVAAVGVSLVNRDESMASPPAPSSAADDPREVVSRRVVPLAEEQGVVVEVEPTSGALIRTDNRHAAGRRTPREVAKVESGLRCPDGSFLPLLNGVTAAPSILRSPDRGPLPPVVAVIVDSDGWDWYEHADGSTTTCRPHVVVGADGERRVRVMTLHNANDESMQEAPLEEPGQGRSR